MSVAPVNPKHFSPQTEPQPECPQCCITLYVIFVLSCLFGGAFSLYAVKNLGMWSHIPSAEAQAIACLVIGAVGTIGLIICVVRQMPPHQPKAIDAVNFERV